MTLSAPNLDDRRFQDLVDDAKRLVQRNCPEWSDHNVSDPGVTLIEAFAYMVDQLIYRLNRVPDRHYVKFLELIGLQLLSASAARCGVTFWLSAPQPAALPVARGTETATLRTSGQEAITFSTVEELSIIPCSRLFVATVQGGSIVDRTSAAELSTEFSSFGERPTPGDALYIGLSNPVPSCAVVVRLSCRTEGVGVDPKAPPLLWEAWDGRGWTACDVDSDGTAGLNQAGDVVIHVPRTHATSMLPDVQLRAAWLRCRLVAPMRDQPTYSDSPQVSRVEAFTIGGTADAVHALVVTDEIIGLSEEVPGQRFTLVHRPLVAMDEPVVVEVADGHGWEPWEHVDTFAGSTATDRHFMLDAANGEVILGPAVREADGSLHYFGAVPTKGAALRVRRYWSGGGERGNVAVGTITQLKSSVPYISRVENRRAAVGGVEGESIEQAKVRAPILLRTRDRAVTTEDYEHLARDAAPELARVRCIGARGAGEEGGVRVLLVPYAGDDASGGPRFEQLVPQRETLGRVRQALDEARPIGSRVSVEPPSYVRVVVVAMVRSRPRTDLARVRDASVAALHSYLHPLRGGPEGNGWPFGRTLNVAELHGALLGVPEVATVDDVKLFWVDPATGERSGEVTRVDLAEHAIIHLFDHQIRVIEA